MRLPMLAWSTAFAVISAASLQQYAYTADPALSPAVYAVNIAMRLAVIAYLVIVAATVAFRIRPTGKAR